MKKGIISLTLTLLLIGGLFTRCEQKLDLSPLGTLDEQTFYQTENDFKGAVLVAYSALLNYTYDQDDAGGWFRSNLMPDDDATAPNNGVDNVDIFNWLPNGGPWSILWETSYKGVQRSNVILEKLPDATSLNDSLKKSFEGEARFLRAYYNFVLVTQFGTAPLIEKTPRTLEETRAPNSKPGELWDAVLSDLKIAKTNLPPKRDDANLGRATSGAASALLGKALLYRAQWENKPELYAQAAAEFEGLAGKYSLVSNYQDNFSTATENNAESIFEVQMGLGGGNPWLAPDFNFGSGGGVASAGNGRLIYFGTACGPNQDCAPGSNQFGYGRIQMTSTIQREFEKGDPRRAASIFIDGDPYMTAANVDGSKNNLPQWIYSKLWSATGSSPAKYVLGDQSDFRPNLSVNNDRVLRYADALLMLAECKILGTAKDLTGAAALINQVRRRADPTAKILPNVPVGNETELFKALRHERRVEFVLECHRYDDLVRWHRAGKINIKTDIDFGVAKANENWAPKHLLRPIPQREIDLNPELVQNPGY
ncbi:MAG: RagB/SusD family nutrient uptake outer membrane protein [Dyadobacter sp.]|uniref:RagB/SusD family nutrient uptake outer membrane protein n=1 Tax=Dyadobacter sp. TaxID=1914288 RepID=UPI003266D1B2